MKKILLHILIYILHNTIDKIIQIITNNEKYDI